MGLGVDRGVINTTGEHGERDASMVETNLMNQTIDT
jgi:hypothetical protein